MVAGWTIDRIYITCIEVAVVVALVGNIVPSFLEFAAQSQQQHCLDQERHAHYATSTPTTVPYSYWFNLGDHTTVQQTRSDRPHAVTSSVHLAVISATGAN